jgi:hypothetical protein
VVTSGTMGTPGTVWALLHEKFGGGDAGKIGSGGDDLEVCYKQGMSWQG